MTGRLFSDQDLSDLQSMHPAYCAVAQEMERVTNSLEFADGMLEVLSSYIRDARDEEDQFLMAARKSLTREAS